MHDRLPSASEGMARRSFLRAAGVAATCAGLGRIARTQELGPPEGPSSRAALDRLLERYRRHQRTGLNAGSPGGGNHIAMTLIAAHRMGATAEQLERYVAHFNLCPDAPPRRFERSVELTRENWRENLGRADFLQFVEYFERRADQSGIDALLDETLPLLALGPSLAFSHDLLRLGYAIDLGSRDEIVFALAHWASQHRAGPAYDESAARFEPDALLAEIVERTSPLQLQADGGRMGPIAFRLDQVYSSREFLGALKPVRIPESDPLARISELILELFTQTQDFTLLHGFTTCQALRLALPHAGDPRRCAASFWHSFCAEYVTVLEFRKEAGK